MEKEFIPYEQALALKELGFNEECLACYTENAIGIGDKLQFLVTPISCNDDYVFVSAPTFSQVFRWFRDKHNLLLDIVAYYDESQLPLTYNNRQKPKGYFVWDLYDENFSEDKALKFKTYEEAELECLKKLIEIVKEQK